MRTLLEQIPVPDLNIINSIKTLINANTLFTRENKSIHYSG